MTVALYRSLASGIEALHALSMLVWGLGLPLLFWHRFRRLSEIYMIYAIAFVVVSVASRWLLGECVLTTLARMLWNAGGGYRDGAPFIARLTNAVAGIRPTERQVVLTWELAILLTSVALLWFRLRSKSARAE